MEESDKTTALKKAYAEMILNTAKESAATVIISDRKSALCHHDLCGTKDEALRLLVRLKHMIDAKTIESEITSSNQQRQIDVLEAQLQEAEEIITDLRSEMRWVREKLEKAWNVVNKEEEETIASLHLSSNQQVSVTMSDSLPNQSSLPDDECGGNDENQFDHKEEETIASLHLSNQQVSVTMSDSLPNQSSLHDDECGENDEKQFDGLNVDNKEEEESISAASLRISNQEVSITTSDSLPNQSSLHDDECGGKDETQFDGLSVTDLKACESELDVNIRNKKLELSRSGCTQRIHALERKSSPCANTEERSTVDQGSEEKVSSVKTKTRSLVLALRASNAEVITLKPSNALGINRFRKKGKKKRKWGKRKATPVKSQTHQLIKPCQSQSGLPCTKTSMDDSDGLESPLSVENEEVDARNACKGLEERLQSNADGIGIIPKKKRSKNVEKLGRMSSPDHVSVEDGESKAHIPKNETKFDPLGEHGVVSSTKMGSELVNPFSDLKATVVSDQIREPSRADGIRLLKYTFQRKRKRGSLNEKTTITKPGEERG